MPPTSLHAKLERLRRGADGAPNDQALYADRTSDARSTGAPDALARLEHAMLGVSEESPALGLKARLERLVQATTRDRQQRTVLARAGRPIEELVQGLRVENEHGEFFLVPTEVPLDSLHGTVPLARLRAASAEAVSLLAGEPGFEDFDLTRAAFIDTETTGLAGGAGTAAFLIGLGYLEDEVFHVKQYFMRDYHEEPALLAALGEDLARFDALVTFNGRMFDIPLLEARYRLNHRRPFPLAHAPHLDLLHPARRLWKARLPSCRLVRLEEELLGLWRESDIPGEAIPEAYFDFVRRKDATAMAKVLAHNRQDIVSLAALAAVAALWLDGSQASDPRDLLSLARVLERGARHPDSELLYRAAAETGSGAVRAEALLRLAERARRRGDLTGALDSWREAAAMEGEGELGPIHALRALAIHHEHRERDIPAALSCVDRALVDLRRCLDPKARRIRDGFGRRRLRLLAKASRGKRSRP